MVDMWGVLGIIIGRIVERPVSKDVKSTATSTMQQVILTKGDAM
jgi:hypothetical protein